MLLKVNNVSRTFNEVRAFHDLSFSCTDGEVIGVLGTSGCGKSTLLRTIAGLDKGYEGSIQIAGQESREANTSIGVMFQEPRLMPWLPVIDNVTFGLKGNEQEKKDKALEMIELVGLKTKENLYPRELSGGMAQRVAIARSLVTSPKILLLDEPLSALDAFTKMQLQDLLLDIWEKRKTTMLLVTHDIDEALYLCDRLLVLRGQPGELHSVVTVDSERPRSRGDVNLAQQKEEILEILDLSKRAS